MTVFCHSKGATDSAFSGGNKFQMLYPFRSSVEQTTCIQENG
ncbi:hypothetical protein T01_55 [Trichinella spiralis]|uniref:Uncharacterized protein n=1 Tax=Trichinella spiralis TaxID=6334 RepID=A0A0V0YV21_TRISP|nr:hypothetical protein T01_55 [Trichinella spiralis]